MLRKVVTTLRPLINKQPRLAAAYRAARDAKLEMIQPEMTPLGFRFHGDEEMVSGKFEIAETEVVRQCLTDADVFINIGANAGYYCCLARHVGKHVLAFEPVPRNLRLLYLNLRANRWMDVEVFPVALGERNGIVDIFGAGAMASLVEGWGGGPHGFRQTVPLFTLDWIMGSRLDGQRCLFLVDVEGAENLVLRGADRHLALNPKPTWMVEISVNEHLPSGLRVNPNLSETFRMFWSHGYRSYTADSRHREVRDADIAALLEEGTNTLGTHNFLFCP